MEIVTRAEAKRCGLGRYYTGVPCINGHLSERMTSNKHCLACHREGRARLRASAPARIKAHKAASYLRHRDEVLAKVAAYQAANREKVLGRQRAFREANKPMIAARYAAWAKENRDLLRVHERRRRARKKGAPGRHTLAEIKALEADQGMKCATPECRADLSPGYHVDHVMPLCLGGSNDIGNIALLCPLCNHRKHGLSPDEWAERRAHLYAMPSPAAGL